jgi:hypothetical protein
MSDEPTPAPPEAPKPEPTRAAHLEPPPEPGQPARKGPLPGRFFRHVTSPDTRAGRSVRATIRALGLIVGFYALGFFTAYILFFQPLQRRSASSQGELAALRSQLTQQQSQLDQAAATLQGADAQRKQSDTSLAKTNARVAVLQALNQVSSARLSLARQDATSASLAFGNADKLVKAALPDMVRLGAAQSTTLTAVLDLAKADLSRDAKLADQDLDRLASELLLVDQNLQ